MSASGAEQAIRQLLQSQSREGDARQTRLQKLGINVEKTKRLEHRIFVWTLADHVLHDPTVKIEKRVQIGLDALNAVAIWALKAMDDSGARDVLRHYRKLLREWEGKRRELENADEEYSIVKNKDTVRGRVTAWAMRDLVPWMEMIADSSWGKDNVEPELPIVVEGAAAGDKQGQGSGGPGGAR